MGPPQDFGSKLGFSRSNRKKYPRFQRARSYLRTIFQHASWSRSRWIQILHWAIQRTGPHWWSRCLMEQLEQRKILIHSSQSVQIFPPLHPLTSPHDISLTPPLNSGPQAAPTTRASGRNISSATAPTATSTSPPSTTTKTASQARDNPAPTGSWPTWPTPTKPYTYPSGSRNSNATARISSRRISWRRSCLGWMHRIMLRDTRILAFSPASCWMRRGPRWVWRGRCMLVRELVGWLDLLRWFLGVGVAHGVWCFAFGGGGRGFIVSVRVQAPWDRDDLLLDGGNDQMKNLSYE